MKLMRQILLIIGAVYCAAEIADARLIAPWSYRDLIDKSDVVAIGTATATREVAERADHVGYISQHVVGVETTFAIAGVLKGDAGMKELVLHHYRAEGMMVPNGPTLVAFEPEKKQTFLLFLVREADGRYAPTSGQIDPVIREIGGGGMESIVPATGVKVENISTDSNAAMKASGITLMVVSADSEETAGEHGEAANAVDGDPKTIWHTQWQDANPEPPHEIIIKMRAPAVIKGFTYLPRQDESDHGTIREYEFYVSDDGKDFGKPVKKGEFEADKEKKTVTFEPRKCQYIKLREISEMNGEAWASAAEIGIVPGE
jgi:hypothetical protein